MSETVNSKSSASCVNNMPMPSVLVVRKTTCSVQAARQQAIGRHEHLLCNVAGTFLQSIASMSRATSVLEIGMFTGSAALACAEVLPPDGRVVTCEFDPYLEPLARGLFDKSPHGRKIQIRIGDARDTLTKLVEEGAKFDLVFIDADKEGYVTYFKKIMEGNLLSEGGTLLFDNALGCGFPYSPNPNLEDKDGAAIKECNEYLKTCSDMHRMLVPIRDGVLMMRKMSETFKSAE